MSHLSIECQLGCCVTRPCFTLFQLTVPSWSRVASAHLLDLPTEILIEILRYLQLSHVPAVAATCRCLRSLLHGPAASQALWRSLHGNSLASDEARRTMPLLQPWLPCDCDTCLAVEAAGPAYRDQLRAGAAWHRGRPLEATLCNFRGGTCSRRAAGAGQRRREPAVLAMPCLQLHGSRLVFSHENRLSCLRLTDGGERRQQAAVYRGTVGAADVTALSTEPMIDGGRALVGTSDGRLLLWTPDDGPPRLLEGQPVDQSAVNCLDSCPAGAAGLDGWRLALAGTKSGAVVAARLGTAELLQGNVLTHAGTVWRSFHCGDRVYACRLVPDGSGAALIGCAGIAAAADQQPTLRLISSETGAQLAAGRPLTDAGLRRRGSGIRAIAFQSASLAVTVGYDAAVRLWDLRSMGSAGQRPPVAVWEDPNDCAGTAVQSDRSHTVLVGLMQHGLVRLYDIRQTRRHLRSFYKGAHYPDSAARLTRSPVYSLDFNQHCFVRGIDSEINCVKFT